MHFLLLITLSLFIAVNSIEENFPVVKIQLGTVVGHYKTSYDGRLFSAFEGIPYAKPPVGSLRFDEPQPPAPWLGNWIADKVHTCIQLYPTGLFGDEDCLYINVYVPKLQPTPEDNLDVVVHIHGGSFTGANPDLAGPTFLMDRDIVYVNFNYRLGVLGFLSTEDDIVKGNMGLKDQVMALQWIQNNIKYFGGNPLSVTLTGVSAGGASTHFHYFSPKSEGLFHRGISQSGTATAVFSIQQAALKHTQTLASSVGCKFDTTRTIIDCLRQRPSSSLILKSETISITPGVSQIPFGPVIEKKSESAFLTDYPFRLLQKGSVKDLPWITSITTEEGILGVLAFMKEFEYIDKHWNKVAPLLLKYNNTCPDSNKNYVSETIKKYYFNNESISEASIPQFIKLFSHRYFALDFEKSARMHANLTKSPIYTYIYGFKDESIDPDKFFGLNGNYGVNHGSDGHLLYDMQLLGIHLSSHNLTKAEEQIKNFMVDFVVRFAKTGKPFQGVGWDQVDSSKDFGYLFIKSPENITMVYQNEVAPKEFWKSLKLQEDEYYET